MCQHPVVIEPTPLSDIFVTGIARIDIIGHNARFYLYMDQNSFVPDAPPDRFIVAKIIVPLENLPGMIEQAVRASGDHGAVQALRKIASAMN